jgi:hypothetical protein
MKIVINGFWQGFLERTNPVHIGFFIDLLTSVFKVDITIVSEPYDADILLESIFHNDTFLTIKEWKYSFLFYGESSQNIKKNINFEKYSCVLGGQRNNKNIVNVPLYVPYLYCNPNILIDKNIDRIPSKSVCTIISNPDGLMRNTFIEKLEQKINIDHAGKYKNNTGHLQGCYNDNELFKFVSNYKFIITMENSDDDTYITEKIVNGFGAGIVPIYWGSKRVYDYFNKDRFLCLENKDIQSIENLVEKIVELCLNDEKYKDILKYPVRNPENVDTSIDCIAKDICSVIFKNSLPKTFIISSPLYEQSRYEKMKIVFKDYNAEFICPTYKQTITDEIMSRYLKDDLTLKLYNRPLLKSEMSLFLNHVSILKHIEKKYKDGIFLVFESDAYPLDLTFFNDFIQLIETKRDKNNEYLWDMISIGLPYSELIYNYWWKEDLTTNCDKIRLIRKKITRCTDSLIWSYTGIEKFLNLLKVENENYCLPIDTYFNDIICKHENFKLYWSSVAFFSQETHDGGIVSTIR